MTESPSTRSSTGKESKDLVTQHWFRGKAYRELKRFQSPVAQQASPRPFLHLFFEYLLIIIGAMPVKSPSLLVCGSVISDPDHAYLSRIRSSIIHNPHLADLRDAVIELPELWPLLVEREHSLERVSAAPVLQNLVEWIECDNPLLPLAVRTSRNAQLAVLTVLSHISEYMIYLSSHDMSEEDGCGNLDAHTSVLEGVRDGGIQGLCVGLLSAIALACSPTNTDVAKHGAVAVRLALCVGALVDLDEIELSEPTVCICTRWPQGEGDGDGREEVLRAVLDSYPQVRSLRRMQRQSCFLSPKHG
jgi:hypothetical protein